MRPKIRDELWVKLWGNLTFNPLSALTHATLEDICRFPATRELAAQVARKLMLNAPENPNQTFCIITIYKSIDGQDDAMADFQVAWKGLVAERLGITEAPAVEKGDPVNGWNSNTATSTFSLQGNNAVAVLTTFSGYHKTMSILVITNDAASQQVLENFFNSLELKKPSVTSRSARPLPATVISSAGLLLLHTTLQDREAAIKAHPIPNTSKP